MLKSLFAGRSSLKQLKRAAEAEHLHIVLERHHVDLFIDVGANIGQTGRSLRQHGYAGRIISVEPLPACHDKLIETSRSDAGWRILDACAFGEQDGEIEIAVSTASDLSSIRPPTAALATALPKVAATGHVKVPIRRLDGALGRDIKAATAPFLKIDAQGHDMAVLAGATGVMDQLAGVQVEMSLIPLYEGETLYLDILNFLHGHGFRPHLLVERTFSAELGRQLQIDGVFMREA